MIDKEGQLFLGSRNARREFGQLSLERESLEALGITHVVVNASMALPFEDSYGIQCVRIDVADTNNTVMKVRVFFNSIYRYG